MTKYGGEHQAARRAGLPAAYGQPCARCGRPMLPGQALDLDHHDDGQGYRGFAHRSCNRSAGGRLGRARQLARGRGAVRRVFEVCALGVEVAEDRGHTAIVAAGRGDGFVAVSLLAYLDGTDSAVEEVQRIGRERTVRAVVVDPFSPAATLIKPLSAAGVSVRQPSSHDTAVAHGVFRDELAAGRLRHAGEPELTAAVRHGTQRRLGGGAAWERRGQPVDVSPLTAATLAVWALVVRNADYDVLSSVW